MSDLTFGLIQNQRPWPAPPVRGVRSQPIFNWPFGGQHRIAGVAMELSVPGPYRLRLYERVTGQLVAETWSAADGTFVFDALANRPQSYYVVELDHNEPLRNAAIVDFITPEPR